MRWVLANRESPQAPLLEERLATDFPDVAITWVDRAGKRLDHNGEPEVFLRNEISRDALITVLQTTPSLRWMHTVSHGVDHLLPILHQYRSDGALRLTKGRGVLSRPIAEFSLGMMIAALKAFPTLMQAQQAHDWRRQGLPIRDLAGARLLVLGLGSIGQEAARLAANVGMRVWGVRHGSSEPVPGVEEVFTAEGAWRDRLPECDLVLIALPLTTATRGIMGAAELAAMSSDSWIINIARGQLVDEAALIDALQAQRIGGAALDVTATEPLPADSPLWDLPNVIISPHVSWRSPAVAVAMLDLFLDNLRRYQAGEPLLNEVQPDAEY